MTDQQFPVDEAKTTESQHGDVTAPHADKHLGVLVEEFKKSVAADRAKAYEVWGCTMLYALEDSEAQAELKALGAVPQDALDFYNAGCAAADAEDFKGAADAFGKAVELDSGLGEALFNRALALELAGQKAKAREAWQAYLDKFPETPEDDVKLIKDRMGALAG
jgi:tetratricopeptide (TPR) repeat protein